MTQNCQRSVVQLDLEPPRPYNAGSCGSCMAISDSTTPTNERNGQGERGKYGDRRALPQVTKSPAPPRSSGLPATSRNTSPIAVEEDDVATLTCNRLRKAIGDKGTFCSLVESQCPTHCNGAADCETTDCNSCSQ